MGIDDLVFISGNQNKIAFLSSWLGHPVNHQKLDLDEIQSLDPHVVAEHKVKQAYDLLHQPVLVEDAGLRFTALGRLPGTFVKWFIEEVGYDGLLQIVNGLEHRGAEAHLCYALYDGTHLHYFDGQMKGTIAREPKGTNGFGFDPIFINDGYTKTRGEMTDEEYQATSYRTDGLNKLKAFLEAQHA
ncbi:MAG TPA: non-canonical purine NTP pyrophosphatase [Bacillota bacterium]|nr:non-canonical purine NTP pyrophosphatase [Bacillota bacterium]